MSVPKKPAAHKVPLNGNKGVAQSSPQKTAPQTVPQVAVAKSLPTRGVGQVLPGIQQASQNNDPQKALRSRLKRIVRNRFFIFPAIIVGTLLLFDLGDRLFFKPTRTALAIADINAKREALVGREKTNTESLERTSKRFKWCLGNGFTIQGESIKAGQEAFETWEKTSGRQGQAAYHLALKARDDEEKLKSAENEAETSRLLIELTKLKAEKRDLESERLDLDYDLKRLED